MNKDKIIKILKLSKFSDEFISYVEKNPIMDLDPQRRVIEYLGELVPLEEYYISRGIPLNYLYDSIYDFNYRIERYHKNHGIYGLTDRDVIWLSPLFKGEIFDLGSLRFHISRFSAEEIERGDHENMSLDQKWKERFPDGTPVIAIHIQDDTDFRPDKIEKSFKMANDFFKQYFPQHDYEVFTCRTWLLYGPMRDILSKDSNIASFSKRFEIIADNQNPNQALDRIYGTNDLETIKQMDKNSSLAQVAYKNLDKLGVATGIIYK